MMRLQEKGFAFGISELHICLVPYDIGISIHRSNVAT